MFEDNCREKFFLNLNIQKIRIPINVFTLYITDPVLTTLFTESDFLKYISVSYEVMKLRLDNPITYK